MDTIAEIACSEVAVHVVDEYAAKRKLNQIQVAAMIPGIVHTHAPSTRLVDECAYCQRNGNVFNSERKTADTRDLIYRYKEKIKAIFEEMKYELDAELDAKLS
jgi:hypothetical protein